MGHTTDELAARLREAIASGESSVIGDFFALLGSEPDGALVSAFVLGEVLAKADAASEGWVVERALRELRARKRQEDLEPLKALRPRLAAIEGLEDGVQSLDRTVELLTRLRGCSCECERRAVQGSSDLGEETFERLGSSEPEPYFWVDRVRCKHCSRVWDVGHGDYPSGGFGWRSVNGG